VIFCVFDDDNFEIYLQLLGSPTLFISQTID
jgi:hypothetical protein